jgi:energy-coupling factor transporter ATP-binding protein EcfA2
MNDNLKVFIINGSGGSGKDTFCNYIEQLATEQNKRYHVESIYTSTPAKEWAKKMGWGGDKHPCDRRFLCNLKDMLDYWNNATYNHIKDCFFAYYTTKSYRYYNKIIFFIHAREEKDIVWIENYCLNKGFSCKSILIKRPNTTKKGNHADDKVEQYLNYDYTIVNDGTLEDFKKKAQDFFEYHIEEYQPVCTTATDSEDVVHGLKNFKYKPERTKEILAKYDGLLDKYNALLKEKNELVIKYQANYEKQKREEKERIELAKKNYEKLPQWKKDALDKWTEDLKESCKQYWEDREY